MLDYSVNTSDYVPSIHLNDLNRLQRLDLPRIDIYSGGGLYNAEAGTDSLLDIFVLVLQQRERVGDIVPLPLALASSQSRCELVS